VPRITRSAFGHHPAGREIAHAHAMLAVLAIEAQVGHQEKAVTPQLPMVDISHRQVPFPARMASAASGLRRTNPSCAAIRTAAVNDNGKEILKINQGRRKKPGYTGQRRCPGVYRTMQTMPLLPCRRAPIRQAAHGG
jgi:hypothetical protein